MKIKQASPSGIHGKTIVSALMMRSEHVSVFLRDIGVAQALPFRNALNMIILQALPLVDHMNFLFILNSPRDNCVSYKAEILHLTVFNAQESMINYHPKAHVGSKPAVVRIPFDGRRKTKNVPKMRLTQHRNVFFIESGWNNLLKKLF